MNAPMHIHKRDSIEENGDKTFVLLHNTVCSYSPLHWPGLCTVHISIICDKHMSLINPVSLTSFSKMSLQSNTPLAVPINSIVLNYTILHIIVNVKIPGVVQL